MASSESDAQMEQPVNLMSANIEELVTLADLAGIKGPGNTMRIVIELITMGIPIQEVHSLLRDILASKSRSKRASAKHSSRRLPSSTEAVQENTSPQL